VLVVDDDRAVREVFERSLQLAGFEVVVAAGGEEGLQILRNDPSICLVLLDLNMPDVDGRKFREMQRSDARLAGISTIILTGSALPLVVHEELQATGYLFKPVRREDLVKVVSRYCDRFSL
jgi:two-component system, chemotaxis family, chemotaxis protein CheY